jgi:membrane associated rhomboid family serine protease
MGWQDRDYYRDSRRSHWDWQTGQATLALVIVFAVAYGLQLLLRAGGEDTLRAMFDFDLGRILQGEVWRLITAPFVQSTNSILAVFFTLYAIYLFGEMFEETRGGKELIAYVAAVIAISQTVEFAARFTGLLPARMASGGWTAVLYALTVYGACQFPRRTVLLFFIFPVPLWLAALLAVLFGLTGLREQVGLLASGVAVALLYYQTQVRLTALRAPQLSSRRRPALRLFAQDDADRETPVPAIPHAHNESSAPPRLSSMDEQLEAKMDGVLEKYARNGKESLTEEEKQILQQASEILRKRREGDH